MSDIKKIFFIDFDDTLFNTKKFKKELTDIFKSNGISEKQFREFYHINDNGKKIFSPIKQIEKLKIKYKINSEKLLGDFNEFVKDAGKFLFADSVRFLEKIDKRNNYLVLLSYGDSAFQKKKILNSGVKSFFDEIIITDNFKLNIIEKHPLAKVGEKIFFIEDHPEQLDGIMKKISENKENIFYKKISIIKIARENGRYSKMKTKFSFSEFSDLDEIIKKVC